MSGPGGPREPGGRAGRRDLAGFYGAGRPDGQDGDGHVDGQEHRFEDDRYEHDGYEHDDYVYGDDGYDEREPYPADDYDDGTWPVVDGPVPPSAAHRRGARTPPRRSGHRLLKALAALVVALVVIIGAGVVWARGQIDPGGRGGALVSVVIPKGSSTTAIGSRLAAGGVIHDGWLFALYVRVHGDGLLYPGTYQLPKNSSYSSVISALKAGPKILTDTLVIPEGYTVAQIARKVAALPHLGLSARKFLAAAQDGVVRSPYEPAGVNNLEGLLFPATYPVRQGETEVDILEQMVGTFDDRAQALDLTGAASRLGMTPYQVVTVASIVEREAKLAADRPNVASTIYNRLRIGMKLGADSTQTYYLRLTDPGIEPTAAQLDQPSPYNTRTNTGLPPTPIANPGMASLSAATTPPTTKYLYFVEISPSGQLGFASTDSGFEHLRQQCQAAGLC